MKSENCFLKKEIYYFDAELHFFWYSVWSTKSQITFLLLLQEEKQSNNINIPKNATSFDFIAIILKKYRGERFL